MLLVFELALIGLAVAVIPLSYVWFDSAAYPDRRWSKLLWVTAFLTLDLVMFGAFTRLTDAGLGCPDWPGCYGAASPFSARAAIRAAQAALPSGPVTWLKAWIEMIHRYFAMAIGALIILLTGRAWQRRLGSAPPTLSPWAPTALLGLVCIQGAFGAWTVTQKLQPLIVTVHLLLGMALLAATAWVAASQTRFAALKLDLNRSALRWRLAAAGGLGLLALQIALGGWVSANYAALACTGFPRCNGYWWPPMDFAQGFQLWRMLGQLGRTGAGEFISQAALVAIHWTHRAVAIVVLAYLGWLALSLTRFEGLRKLAVGLLIMVAAQFATGLATLLLSRPLPVAVAHNGGAAVMVLLLTVLNFRIASHRFPHSRAHMTVAPSAPVR